MLLYKFFFFNYVFQVTGPDIMESLMSGEPEDPLKHFGRDFPPIMKPYEMNQAQREEYQQASSPNDHPSQSKLALQENASILNNLMKSFMLIVQTLHARRRNLIFDQAIKPFKQGAQSQARASAATGE